MPLSLLIVAFVVHASLDYVRASIELDRVAVAVKIGGHSQLLVTVEDALGQLVVPADQRNGVVSDIQFK